MKRNALFLLIAALMLFVCSCGGSSIGLDDTAQENPWPGHGWDAGAKAGSFTAVAVDDTERNIHPLTENLELSVSENSGSQRVAISARELPGVASVFLHLKYDESSVHPVVTSAGSDIADEALFLGVASEPGIVVLGIVMPKLTPSLSGDMLLAEVSFAEGAFSAVRGATEIDEDTNKVTDLTFNAITPGTLEWHYKNVGDYDQNSEVNIADLTPLGANLGESVAPDDFAVDSEFAPIDGDGNGQLNIADITPIGANFRDRVTGYIVQSGDTANPPFTTVVGTAVAQSSGTGTGYLFYSLALPAPVEGDFYVVLPVDGATQGGPGSESNAVLFSTSGGPGAPEPPVNLTAQDQGGQIMLAWQPPLTGESPTGYNLYFGDAAADFTGTPPAAATKINTSPVVSTVLMLDAGAFPTSSDFFFSATAVNSGGESAFSNTVDYQGTSPTGCNPPIDLTGSNVGGNVLLEWNAPASGVAPDQYMVRFFAEQPTGGLGDSPEILTVTAGTSFQTTKDATVEGWFQVLSMCGVDQSSPAEFHNTGGGGGGDTTPPVWQGGTGIKSVAPGFQQVEIEWYLAIDAETPPVEYYVYFVEEAEAFDWQSPAQVYPSGTLSAFITGLPNDVTYKFAVRAVDAVVDPAPNMTTNENFLLGTARNFPPTDGAIDPGVIASDTASVRMQGEEIPRIFSVSRGTDLTYTTWDAAGGVWESTNISPLLNMDAGIKAQRKYHPQALAIGDEIHVVFGTNSGVHEAFGPKDADPGTWTFKTISTNVNSVFGIGFSYSATGDYFACCFATDFTSEQVFYSDRDSDGDWNTAVSVIDPTTPGDDEVWQCDMTINEANGSQWIVAAVGHADSTEDALKFWYATRADRLGAWTAANTGYGGDVMVVEIDPNINQPVVVDAEVREVSSIAGDVPVSDATVFIWNGTNWTKQNLEQGDFIFDQGSADTNTILTGQDPQLVFSPTGKAVALWTYLDMYVNLLDTENALLTGDWRKSVRTSNVWGPPQSIALFISSSNAVTTGEGYHHCVTCDLGTSDSGDYNELANKYAQRNNYVEGDLRYFYEPWE